MSRTYKDKDFYLRFPEEKFDFAHGDMIRVGARTLYNYDVEKDEFTEYVSDIEYISYRWLDKPGVKTKKPRHYKGDWKWYRQTPSWFVREFMTTPKRAACRNWEKQAIYADDLEDFEDCPDFGRKPHVYFY